MDIATLTGACIVSLGEEYAGLWSNNDVLLEQLKASAKATGEKLWHMPLCDEYAEQVVRRNQPLAFSSFSHPLADTWRQPQEEKP